MTRPDCQSPHRYDLAMNDKAHDLLGWLATEMECDHGTVVLKALYLMKLAVDGERRGLRLGLYAEDEETGEVEIEQEIVGIRGQETRP